MSEVRGSSRECQTATAQERPRGATPRPRSGAEAGRTPCLKGNGQEDPTSEVRGSGLECQAAMAQERPRRATQVRGQGRQLRGATPHLRSGAEASRLLSRPCRKRRPSSRDDGGVS